MVTRKFVKMRCIRPGSVVNVKAWVWGKLRCLSGRAFAACEENWSLRGKVSPSCLKVMRQWASVEHLEVRYQYKEPIIGSGSHRVGAGGFSWYITLKSRGE